MPAFFSGNIRCHTKLQRPVYTVFIFERPVIGIEAVIYNRDRFRFHIRSKIVRDFIASQRFVYHVAGAIGMVIFTKFLSQFCTRIIINFHP